MDASAKEATSRVKVEVGVAVLVSARVGLVVQQLEQRAASHVQASAHQQHQYALMQQPVVAAVVHP